MMKNTFCRMATLLVVTFFMAATISACVTAREIVTGPTAVTTTKDRFGFSLKLAGDRFSPEAYKDVGKNAGTYEYEPVAWYRDSTRAAEVNFVSTKRGVDPLKLKKDLIKAIFRGNDPDFTVTSTHKVMTLDGAVALVECGRTKWASGSGYNPYAAYVAFPGLMLQSGRGLAAVVYNQPKVGSAHDSFTVENCPDAVMLAKSVSLK